MEKGLGPCRITPGHGGGWDPVVVPAALGPVPRVCPAVLGWSLLASWRREEELGRAVPSQCGETRAGRQLEAVPPPCSISVDGGAGVKQGFVPLSPTLQPMYQDKAWEDLLPLLQDSPAH